MKSERKYLGTVIYKKNLIMGEWIEIGRCGQCGYILMIFLKVDVRRWRRKKRILDKSELDYLGTILDKMNSMD